MATIGITSSHNLGLPGIDAFSKGVDIVLQALRDEAQPPASHSATEKFGGAAAIETADSRWEVSSLWAYIHAAASRFENPSRSTVIRIGSVRRSLAAT